MVQIFLKIFSNRLALQKEQAILRVANQRPINAKLLDSFIRSLEPVWPAFARAKSAKLIKSLLDAFPLGDDESIGLQIRLVEDLVGWCERDGRAFLRQSLEARLGQLYLKEYFLNNFCRYLNAKQYTVAIELITRRLRGLKRMEDKVALVETHLLESRVYFSLKNLAKAKAALTAARSAANSIYCPPLLQAALDLQSGLVHVDDGDAKTASSYFIEALDAYAGTADAAEQAMTALKYLVLCKILLGQIDEVEGTGAFSGKLSKAGLALEGPQIEAMKAVGRAYKNRSIHAFNEAMQAYPAQLAGDRVIQTHLASLYAQLLEANILRVIEPYSRVLISHIATQVGLEEVAVEAKLSQMILDQIIPSAILDQHARCLIIHDQPAPSTTHTLALNCLTQLELAVDGLYAKAGRLGV